MILDTSPRIVVVDDSEDDYLLIARQIRKQLPKAEITLATGFRELLAALEKDVDLVVCDYHMQELTHDQVVELVSGYQPAIPLILMSGLATEALGVRAMHSGVRDYVEKSKPERLIPIILRELNTRKLQHNIEELQKAQKVASLVDQHTGFLNPQGLAETLADLQDSPEPRTDVALLSIHLHTGGTDSTLTELSAQNQLQMLFVDRLKAMFPAEVVCKWTDRDFVVLIDRLPSKHTEQNEFEARLDAWELALNHLQAMDRLPARLKVSAGLARLQADGKQAAELVSHAQAVGQVLARQKKTLRHALHNGVHDLATRRQTIQTGLAHGIQNNELTLMYQPIKDLRTQRICGLEALVRWVHPELGLIMPDEFIEVAEDSGLIEELGLWVIQQASRQLLELHAEGHTMWCAVNCSAHQLLSPHFAQTALMKIAEEGLSPKWIEFEVTESAAIQDMNATIATLNVLRQAGCKVAMDDFGTGYASLNYLRKLPIDVLKIDKSFVSDILESDRSRKIVSAVIELAHALDLIVHAEGIETEAQCMSLIEMQCDRMQGYLLGKPMDITQLRGQIN